MLMDKSEFEKKVLDLTKRVLDEYGKKISELNLRFELFGPKLFNKDVESYTSEIKICFYKDGEMMDILEFFIFRDGREVASLDEIKEWLKNNVDDVLRNYANRVQ